jgi:hypothetical protein
MVFILLDAGCGKFQKTEVCLGQRRNTESNNGANKNAPVRRFMSQMSVDSLGGAIRECELGLVNLMLNFLLSGQWVSVAPHSGKSCTVTPCCSSAWTINDAKTLQTPVPSGWCQVGLLWRVIKGAVTPVAVGLR